MRFRSWPTATRVVRRWAWALLRATEVGEPCLSYFMPAAIARKLRDLEFTIIEFPTPAAAAVRYFANRPNDLPVPRRTSIVSARR